MATTRLARSLLNFCKRDLHVLSSSWRNPKFNLHSSHFPHQPRTMLSTDGPGSQDSKQDSDYLDLLQLNPKRLKRIQFLSELFGKHGYQLRIAGGAVRDLVNNIEPEDIDLATDAHPDDSLRLVNAHSDLLRVIVTPAGQKHGTVAVKFKETDDIDIRKRLKISETESFVNRGSTGDKEVVYDDESPFEITTLRCDKVTDGRHAEVVFVDDWKIDAERRDLTINSMFLNINDGKLIDYFGGEEDCRNKIVRFVGDAGKRIREDYLRIMRYFRFWQRFSRAKPEPELFDTIRENMGGLHQISGERIWQELKKVFSCPPCADVYKLMLDLRLFDYVGVEDKNLVDYQDYIEEVMTRVVKMDMHVGSYFNNVLKPGLKKNPKDQNLKRIKELLPVIIFSNCIRESLFCLSAQQRLKFSNIERDLILYTVENRDKQLDLKSFKFQLATSQMEYKQLLLRIKLFLIGMGQFDMIEQLESWPLPVFPVNGKIVAKAVREKQLPNSKTREVIELLKVEWAKNDYQENEDMLLSKVGAILDKLIVDTNQ